MYLCGLHDFFRIVSCFLVIDKKFKLCYHKQKYTKNKVRYPRFAGDEREPGVNPGRSGHCEWGATSKMPLGL